MDKKRQRMRDWLRNNYPPLRTDQSAAQLDLSSNGSDPTYILLRATEKSGIAGYFTGGDVGVIGKSVTGEIGVWGISTADKAVAGTTDSGIGVYGDAATTGRGVVGTTASTTLGGVVARNTSTGPALVAEGSYVYFEEGLIVNGTGGSATTSDFRVAGDTNTHLIFTDASADRVGIAESIPNATLDVNGTTRLGDSDTNYAAFAADGELTLHGTARIEREFILPASGFGTGGAKPSETIDTNFLGYAFDLNDKGYFTFEVPSDWDPTSDIEVAIHWYSTETYATNSGEVRWAIIWSAVKEDGSEVISVNNTTTPSADVNLPATAKRLVETKIHLPAASFDPHDVIGFQISRVALVDGNNPSAARAPVVVSAEIEYIANRLGLAT